MCILYYRQNCGTKCEYSYHLSLSLSLSLSLFPEFATIESPPHRSCIGLKLLRQLCSWHRLVVLVITAVPLLYLIAIEIAITVHNEELVC